MNPHLKLAYDQGVQKALEDAGLIKESIFRNAEQYRLGKELLEVANTARKPRDLAGLMLDPRYNKALQLQQSDPASRSLVEAVSNAASRSSRGIKEQHMVDDMHKIVNDTPINIRQNSLLPKRTRDFIVDYRGQIQRELPAPSIHAMKKYHLRHNFFL